MRNIIDFCRMSDFRRERDKNLVFSNILLTGEFMDSVDFIEDVLTSMISGERSLATFTVNLMELIGGGLGWGEMMREIQHSDMEEADDDYKVHEEKEEEEEEEEQPAPGPTAEEKL